MTLVLTLPQGQPDQVYEIATTNQGSIRAQGVSTDLNSCSAVGGFTTADIIAALASGAAEVCFPPGDYAVTALISQTQSNQVLTFQSGAELVFAASATARLVINGDGASIQGDPVGRFDVTNAGSYSALELHGIGSWCSRWRWVVNADVANCRLMQLSGQSSSVGTVVLGGVGAFLVGVEFAKQDDSQVSFVEAGPLLWQMEDDGVTTRNYDSLIRMRATRSGCLGLSITSGGRQVFANAIVDDDGTHNWIRNPQIESSASPAGILMRDDAEFLEVFGGEIVGNYLAGSVGIQCGDGSKLVGTPAVGQLKCYGTKVRNWEKGVLITGSADSPSFFGATIANNELAQVEIDSERVPDVWPVSGLSFYGCYSEEAAFPGAPFLHLVSGELDGGSINGGEFGYTGTAIMVEPTMGANVLQVDGGRWPAAAPTDAITTPNTLSLFYFTRRSQDGSNLIGKGAFAANAMSAFDPTLEGLVIGASNPGSITNRVISSFTDIYTANFGNLLAGAFQTLDFSFPGVPTVTTSQLLVTMSEALGTKISLGIVFNWWVDASGHIGGMAYNPTAGTINGISGGVRFSVGIFG